MRKLILSTVLAVFLVTGMSTTAFACCGGSRNTNNNTNNNTNDNRSYYGCSYHDYCNNYNNCPYYYNY